MDTRRGKAENVGHNLQHFPSVAQFSFVISSLHSIAFLSLQARSAQFSCESRRVSLGFSCPSPSFLFDSASGCVKKGKVSVHFFHRNGEFV